MLAGMLLVAQLGAGEVVQHVTVQGVELDVVASSLRVEKGERSLRYGPANLVDDRPDTVWAEGVPGPGVGEWVELRFPRPTVLLGFEVLPGDGGSNRLLAAAGSPVGYALSVDGRTFREQRLDFASGRVPDWAPILAQVYWFPQPTAVTTLRLRVTSVHRGLERDDTCISTFRPILADAAGEPRGDASDLLAQAWRFGHASPEAAPAFLSAQGVSFTWTTWRQEGTKMVSSVEELDAKAGPLEPAAAEKLRRTLALVRGRLAAAAESGFQSSQAAAQTRATAEAGSRTGSFAIHWQTAAQAALPVEGNTIFSRMTVLGIGWRLEPQGWRVSHFEYNGP